jgi:hypothetical protein
LNRTEIPPMFIPSCPIMYVHTLHNTPVRPWTDEGKSPVRIVYLYVEAWSDPANSIVRSSLTQFGCSEVEAHAGQVAGCGQVVE